MEYTSDDPGLPELMQDHGFSAYDFRSGEMDKDDAYRLGISLSEMYDNSGKVVVGRDHRYQSKRMKDALITGLTSPGSDLEIIDVGLAPTDMVSYLAVDENAAGGVAVTASHMPPDYHGIKPLTDEGRIFDESELREALERYQENQHRKIVYPDFQEMHFGEPYENYIEGLESRYWEIFDEDLSDIRVAVDPGNGIGGVTLPPLLEALGVDEEDLYMVNDYLDPAFSGRSPDPVKDDLDKLKDLVVGEDLDIGIALDGDADRVVYVNEDGEKVSGDESLGILADKFLEEAGHQKPMIACSGNTCQLVEDVTVESGGLVNYQPVGAVFPAKEALSSNSVVLGGQPNGHYLDPGFTPYDSGTLFGAVMPGIMNERGESLADMQSDLPQYDIARMDFGTERKDEALEILRNMTNIRSKDNRFEGIYRAKIGGGALEDMGAVRNLIFRSSGSEDIVRLTLESKVNEEILDDMSRVLREDMEEQSS